MKRNITPAGKKVSKVIFLISFFIAALLLNSCSKEDEMITPAPKPSPEASLNGTMGAGKPEMRVPVSDEVSKAPIMPEGSMIYIVHGSCFGDCSTYTVSVTPEGEVIYTGYDNVGTVGSVKYSIGREAASEMANAMISGGFLQLHDIYRGSKMDTPVTLTGLHMGKELTKIVVAYGFATPPELSQMRRMMELKLGIDKLVSIQPYPLDLPSPVSPNEMN